MEEREQIKKMLDKIVEQTGDKELLYCLYSVSDTKEIAQELIDFIKEKEIVCFDLLDDVQYDKYHLLLDKCMEIAKREGMGEFFD